MARTYHTKIWTALAALPLVWAQSSSSSSCGPAPSAPSGAVSYSLASGYRMQVVATGLSEPRGLALDGAGNLLVVEQGRGIISAHTLQENNGCVSIGASSDVTANLSLNHGIAISEDGRTLYASSDNDAWSFDYNAQDRTVSSQRTLVTNMEGSGHSTRTLLLSRLVPGMLVIPKGSLENYDIEATDITTGSSQVKAFNIANLTGDPYDYNDDGLLLGWGLRNEVGLGEHPVSGGIWGVENSADQMTRMGVDIHVNNPAEEMNFLGYLNGTATEGQGQNFGYPYCFSAWAPGDLPMNQGIEVGDQFAIDEVSALNNENRTDEYCADQQQARLVFQAHMAPLDIKFNDSGREAWITFRGSWNRPDPIGYKLSRVEFDESGEPVAEITSTTAAEDIFSNSDLSRCPGSCFRPVAMAIDPSGRIYMSSDYTGEIYLISRDEQSNGTPSAGPSQPSQSSQPANTGSSLRSNYMTVVIAALAALLVAMML